PRCPVLRSRRIGAQHRSFESSGPRRIGARGNGIIGTGLCFSDHLVGGSLERFTRSRLGTGGPSAENVLTEGWGAAALPPYKEPMDREPQPRPSALFLVREDSRA